MLSNLGDAVEEFLIRAHIRLPEQGAAPQKEQAPDKPLSTFSATPASQRKSQARLLRKWNLYQQVQHLHASGMSLRKIGEELGVARNTVRKYFRQPPEPPLPTPRPLRASQLDPYEDYLLERWSQGERNAAQLYREISARGYRGAATMVRAYISHHARPRQMALLLAHASSVPRRSPHVRCAGCSRASGRISSKKKQQG
jgi:transposase